MVEAMANPTYRLEAVLSHRKWYAGMIQKTPANKFANELNDTLTLTLTQGNKYGY